jgi:hypothetical protein
MSKVKPEDQGKELVKKLKEMKKTPARKSFQQSISDYVRFFKTVWKTIKVAVPLIVTLTFLAAGVVVILTGRFNVEVPQVLGQASQIIAGSIAVIMGAHATHKVIRWSVKDGE